MSFQDVNDRYATSAIGRTAKTPKNATADAHHQALGRLVVQPERRFRPRDGREMDNIEPRDGRGMIRRPQKFRSANSHFDQRFCGGARWNRTTDLSTMLSSPVPEMALEQVFCGTRWNRTIGLSIISTLPSAN